jgi:hypothetical protein
MVKHWSTGLDAEDADLGARLGVVLSSSSRGWHHRCSRRSVLDLPCLIWTSREAV